MYNKDLGTVLNLTAQAAGTLKYIGENQRWRGIKVYINQSAHSGTPSTTVTIYGKDNAGNRKSILASAAITTTDGLTVLTIYPAIAVAANASANDVLPYNFDVEAVVGGTSPSVTMQISATLIA
jgi:hypothetical protein